MTISASVVCHSLSDTGYRLCTFQLRYPRLIHSEVMTHRHFSRNASSSRAIPAERSIQTVVDDPAMPVFWGKNKPGMQATEELTGRERQAAEETWLAARDYAVIHARVLAANGVHKQLVNRVIEPWSHISVVCTATDLANFFALRRHPDAQPEIHALADAMHDALQKSSPRVLRPGQWHLPYVVEEDHSYLMTIGKTAEQLEIAIKLSVARCARVSYLTHDQKRPKIEEDLRLYDRLVGSVPLHASPCEHQATPDWKTSELPSWAYPHEHGNFTGWRQYRKMLANECVGEAR